jgi:hypothetical protein
MGILGAKGASLPRAFRRLEHSARGKLRGSLSELDWNQA